MMEKKICTICNLDKELTFFTKRKWSKDGYRNQCKECRTKIQNRTWTKEKAKEYNKNYRLKNFEILRTKRKQFREENKELISKRNKIYRIKNKAKLESKDKEYYLKNKNKISEKKYNNRVQNPEKVRNWKRSSYERSKLSHHKVIRNNLSSFISAKLRKRNTSKARRTIFNILGYKLTELISHLENLFKPGMTWDNYGKGKDKWNIDHVTPDSWFIYTSIEDKGFKQSWALENLQPMWSAENLSKNNRYKGEYKNECRF